MHALLHIKSSASSTKSQPTTRGRTRWEVSCAHPAAAASKKFCLQSTPVLVVVMGKRFISVTRITRISSLKRFVHKIRSPNRSVLGRSSDCVLRSPTHSVTSRERAGRVRSAQQNWFAGDESHSLVAVHPPSLHAADPDPSESSTELRNEWMFSVSDSVQFVHPKDSVF